MAEEVMLPALLEWFNHQCADKIQSLDDLSSGTILWQVLREIDPEAFIGDLPVTDNAEAVSESRNDHLVNLKHIHDALAAYLVQQCCKKLPLPSGEPDLEAIAKDPSAKEVTQLLKLVLLAAVFGRFSMDHIQQLMSFSEGSQAQFYLVLEEPEATEIPEEDPFTGQKASTDGEVWETSQDVQGERADLVYEERIAELVAAEKDLKRERVELKEQLESMHDLHTKLQKSYDNLEIQHQDTAERLDALRSGKGEKSMLGIQRTKMQQQETVIATLETQLRALQDENNNLKAQSEILENRSQGFQQMQDDAFEMKLELEQLRRKANAADKYKQKLQSLQEVEKENEALKHRATEMQRQLKESDSEQFNISDLRRENDEFRRLVANIEQELSDSNEAKKRAEFEKLTLTAKLQQADDQAKRWHARAEELQNRLNENSTPVTPTTPRASTGQALDPAPSDDGSASESNLSEGMSKLDVDELNMISQAEWETMLTIMRAHAQSNSHAEKTISIDEQQKLAAKIENMRVTARETSQQTKDPSNLIASELASAINAASSTTDLPQPTTSSETVQPDMNLESNSRFQEAVRQKANLERELQLMASAWYDQNARLMSNTVNTTMYRGRAPPEPRSFLGKQRRLIDGVLTGRS